jgi:hypothetical protein
MVARQPAVAIGGLRRRAPADAVMSLGIHLCRACRRGQWRSLNEARGARNVRLRVLTVSRLRSAQSAGCEEGRGRRVRRGRSDRRDGEHL